MSKRKEADSGLRAGFISEDEALRQLKSEADPFEDEQGIPEEIQEPLLPVPETVKKKTDPQDEGPTIEMKGISGKSITSVIKVVKKASKPAKKEKQEEVEPAADEKAKVAAAGKEIPAKDKADKKKAVKDTADIAQTEVALKDKGKTFRQDIAVKGKGKEAEQEVLKQVKSEEDKAEKAAKAPKTAAAAKSEDKRARAEVKEKAVKKPAASTLEPEKKDEVRRDLGAQPTKVAAAPFRPQSGSYVGSGADAPAVSRRDSVQRQRGERKPREDKAQTAARPARTSPGRGRSFDRPAGTYTDKDREEAPRQTRSPRQPVKQQPAVVEDGKSATRSQYVQRSQQKSRHDHHRRDQVQRDREEVFATRMRKRGAQKQPSTAEQKQAQILTNVKLPDSLTVKELAEALKKTTADIIMKLMGYGVMATVNQEIDFDTAEIIANEFQIKAEKLIEVSAEEILFDDSLDKEEDLLPRPPVVVVMGHVDHGKTSILDYIREASVASGEAGGITQKIGAYTVVVEGQQITFIDTPGHEAFTTMRARGAQVTDLAVLVVAADDGVMPQTVEAIHHARAAGTEILVAINKIDKPNINIDRVLTELAQHDLISSEWGGSTTIVQVSAKTGENMAELLSMILLTAEMLELKANPNRQAKGTVIEAKLDRARGVVATLLVQRGTLSVGDTIVVGSQIGHVRAMHNDKGKVIKSAGPSTPVEVMGLSEVPEGGDVFYEVDNDRTARALVDRRREQEREISLRTSSRMSLENLYAQMGTGEVKDLNIIVKADLKGSVEALTSSLEKLSNEEIQVKVIHGAVGAITETDIRLAEVSDAIVIGFSVRPAANVPDLAEEAGVDIRLYRVIYHAIEDIEKAMKGMLDPEFKEVVLGHADVRDVFKISGVGSIAGCYVTDGKILRNSEIRVVRDGIVIHEGSLDSLRRFKDDVREVASGFECGIGIYRFNDIKVGDQLESFEIQEIKRN